MTPADEKALATASKHSSYAALALAGIATLALFGGPFLFPLVALPLWAAGVVQRLTEKPWFAGAAALWGLTLAVIWSSPAIGVAALVPAGLAVRHWLVLRRAQGSGNLPTS